MASGKRASMREGPLAALFRRTDEDETQAEGQPSAAERPPAEPPAPAADAPRSEPPPAAPAPRTEFAPRATEPQAETPPPPASAAPPPATAAGRQEPRAAQPPADERAPERPRRSPEQRHAPHETQQREAPPHPRETGYPHPSLGATPPPVEIEEPRLPTPQERLRHAFSSDIPDNMLERPAEEPYEDPPDLRVAADEPTPWGHAKPVGQ